MKMIELMKKRSQEQFDEREAQLEDLRILITSQCPCQTPYTTTTTTTEFPGTTLKPTTATTPKPTTATTTPKPTTVTATTTPKPTTAPTPKPTTATTAESTTSTTPMTTAATTPTTTTGTPNPTYPVPREKTGRSHGFATSTVFPECDGDCYGMPPYRTTTTPPRIQSEASAGSPTNKDDELIPEVYEDDRDDVVQDALETFK